MAAPLLIRRMRAPTGWGMVPRSYHPGAAGAITTALLVRRSVHGRTGRLHSVRRIAQVDVAPPAQPLLRLLHAQRAHQAQASVPIREDAHHPGPALQLLVEPLQPI